MKYCDRCGYHEVEFRAAHKGIDWIAIAADISIFPTTLVVINNLILPSCSFLPLSSYQTQNKCEDISVANALML